MTAICKQHTEDISSDYCCVKDYPVLCVGTAIIDFTVFVSDEWLAATDVMKGGVKSLSFDDFSKLIRSLPTNPPLVRAGGGGGTVAKGLASLGSRTAFFSSYGSDPEALFFQTSMKNFGIELFGATHNNQTAKVICAITDDGQRTFFFCSDGINVTPSIDDLDDQFLDKTSLVHLEGYAVRNPLFVEELLKRTSNLDARISMDLGSFVIVQENRSFIQHNVIKHLDFLFGNEDEMRALFGSPNSIDQELRQLPSTSFALQGEKGCTIYSYGEVMRIPVRRVTPLDSSGAGDLFISGILYGLTQGWSIAKSAALACTVSSHIVSVKGAELPESSWTKIKREFSLSHPLNEEIENAQNTFENMV